MPDRSPFPIQVPVTVDLRGIAKLYGQTAALKATNLRLVAGETLALLGPNGSGKTTLLKVLAGVTAPTLGEGTILGHDIRMGRLALRGRVGFLASETYLYDDLSAVENLRFVAIMSGRRESIESLHRVLAAVGLLRHAHDRVRGFSSGMKKRLALARILLLRPDLILLDEPYNSLDEAGAGLIDDFVGESAANGCTIILATHDAERGLAIADRVAVLVKGVLTYMGSVSGYQATRAHYVG